MKRGRTYILGLLIMLLAPLSANAQWSFDVGTVEAYINDNIINNGFCCII